MDETEDDARYPPNSYGANHQHGYGSSSRQKLPVRNPPYPQVAGNQYMDDEVDEDEEDEEELGEEEEDDDEGNGVQRIDNHVDVDVDVDVDDGDEDEDDQKPNVFKRRIEDFDFERHPKKRKLKNMISNYEFAPRVAAPSAAAGSAPKGLFGGRNPLSDWTEHETLVLLDAWGDRFVQHGRKSLRSEEWQEVAEKVSQESKTERTDTQCRNRLDTLKKKYKKEKMKLAETSCATSKWGFFKKMDVLMTSSARQAGLSCGLDSGEYVFMNPKVYLNHANGLDEMRDSPGNSESTEDEGNDSDELPPKRKKLGGGSSDGGSSFSLIADSIYKFSEIYEKVEKSKRQQMAELEKMRMDFHRDLEMKKRQILEEARTEIAKIHQGDDEENDVSTENVSG